MATQQRDPGKREEAADVCAAGRTILPACPPGLSSSSTFYIVRQQHNKLRLHTVHHHVVSCPGGHWTFGPEEVESIKTFPPDSIWPLLLLRCVLGQAEIRLHNNGQEKLHNSWPHSHLQERVWPPHGLKVEGGCVGGRNSLPRNLPLNGKEEEESAFEGNKVKGGNMHHHQAGSSLLPAPPRVDGCHEQKEAGTRINTTFNQQLTVYKKR